MAEIALIEQLRHALPTLLREHPEVRYELWGMMLEAFPSRQEFMALLDEMRASREETNRRFEEQRQETNRRFEELRQEMNSRFEAVDRRFEAIDRRFEAIDRRFEAVIEELRDHGRQLRDLNIHLSALGGRVGHGLEDMVKAVVEEFAGHTFPVAEHLLLRDETGEVFGVVGAEVEFDLYVHNGEAYLVEVKSHLKPGDVVPFYRKVQFARQKLGKNVIPLILALSMDAKAEESMRNLGIRYRVRATISR